ncbi:MAG TPA: hypothetical protein DHW64_13355 [Chitinophagaceae bacterium]|nr:hypothetical protein [Chitinophagaceae bacterium]
MNINKMKILLGYLFVSHFLISTAFSQSKEEYSILKYQINANRDYLGGLDTLERGQYEIAVRIWNECSRKYWIPSRQILNIKKDTAWSATLISYVFSNEDDSMKIIRKETKKLIPRKGWIWMEAYLFSNPGTTFLFKGQDEIPEDIRWYSVPIIIESAKKEKYQVNHYRGGLATNNNKRRNDVTNFIKTIEKEFQFKFWNIPPIR